MSAPSVPPPSSQPQDFIWPKSALASGIQFYVVQQGTGTTHTLTSADGIHVSDNIDTGGFVLHTSADAVVLDSIGKNSIFTMPTGFSFSGLRTTSNRLLGINAVMRSGTMVFIATDSGLYRSSDEHTWTMTLAGRVTALAQDSQKNLYTAIGDTLFNSNNQGSFWFPYKTSHNGARITALACRNDGRVYVGYGDGSGVEFMDPAGYAKYPNALPVKFSAIAAIAVQVVDSITEVIVADSTSITVLHGDDSVNGSVPVANVGCLFLNDTGAGYAGSNTLGLFFDKPFQPTWNSIVTTTQDAITALAVDASGRLYVASFGGSILRNDSGLFNRVGPLRPNARTMTFGSNGEVLIGTDSGLWIVGSAGELISVTGPSGTMVTQNSSGLMLLDRVGMAVTPSQISGSSWYGGTLVGPGLASGIPITARVEDHVDSLKVPDALGGGSTTYGESYIIRYAPESYSNTVAKGFPMYWIVYYAHGVGPVLIQEYVLGSDQKYAIQQQATYLPKR